MVRMICDNCGTNLPVGAVHILDCQVSDRSNVAGVCFTVTVEHADLCEKCICELIVTPDKITYRRAS